MKSQFSSTLPLLSHAQMLDADFLDLQLSLPPSPSSLRDLLPPLLLKNMSSLLDYIDTNPEVPTDPPPHTKSPQSGKGPEAVRGMHPHPLLPEDKSQ
jgi:hypothetical protein